MRPGMVANGAVRSFPRPSRHRATCSPLTVTISAWGDTGFVICFLNTLPIGSAPLLDRFQF
jgi:hypothetical protein